MAYTLTPKMEAAFIEWVKRNPEAILDFVHSPEEFVENYLGAYEDSSLGIEHHGPASNAWSEFLALRKMFFPRIPS